jgi:hypothetical protein
MTDEMKDILEEAKRRVLWDSRGKKLSKLELRQLLKEEIERLIEKRNVNTKNSWYEKLRKAGIMERSFNIVEEE